MAVAMVITMAGCGSSGKKVEATKIDVTFDQIEFRKNYTDIVITIATAIEAAITLLATLHFMFFLFCCFLS